MTPVAFQVALCSFTRRRPFKPFLIELHSGDRFRIPHPEAVRIRGPLVMFISPGYLYRLFDHESVCQLCDEPPAPTG